MMLLLLMMMMMIRANQSLILLLIDTCTGYSGKAATTNFIVFGLTRKGVEAMMYHTQDEHANHSTIQEALCLYIIDWVSAKFIFFVSEPYWSGSYPITNKTLIGLFQLIARLVSYKKQELIHPVVLWNPCCSSYQMESGPHHHLIENQHVLAMI